MSTKVFLSWSGDLSRKAAEFFKDWLEIVIQELEIFYSEDDITKGSNGIETIFRNLRESAASVIMLTKENQTSPWICFEAGAIFTKSEDSYACGLMLDFSADELEGPLKSIQQTPFEKKEVFKMLKAINSKCASPLTEERLKRVFDRNWDNLEHELSILISAAPTSKVPTKQQPKSTKSATKRTENTGETSELVESFYTQAVRLHREKLRELLLAAVCFNDCEKEWSINDMAKALHLSRSKTESLVTIAQKNGLVTGRRIISYDPGSDSFVYKIGPEALVVLANQEKRQETSEDKTD